MTSNNAGTDRASDRDEVRHNENDQRFEISTPGAAIARADYRRDGDILTFHHTFVPTSARGQGLAGRVVRAGLDYAKARGLRVVPQCSYVAGFIERHPEYAALVVR